MNPFASYVPSEDGQSFLYEVEWRQPGAAEAILRISISIPVVERETQQQSDDRAIREVKAVAARFSKET